MSSYAQNLSSKQVTSRLSFTPLYVKAAVWAQKAAGVFKSSLQVLGFVAAMVVGYVAVTPSARQAILDLRPAVAATEAEAVTAATEEEATEPTVAADPTDAKAVAREQAGQAAITRYLSRKYRVAGSAVQPLIQQAYEVGKEMNLDPLLIIAVMGIESSYNPYAESVVGAQGLMQVMTSVHKEKFEAVGGLPATDPAANIRVGAMILKDCIRRGGSVQAGLSLYVGAGMGPDGGYGAKVLAERGRIEGALRGRNIDTLIAQPQMPKPVTAPVTNVAAPPVTHSTPVAPAAPVIAPVQPAAEPAVTTTPTSAPAKAVKPVVNSEV